MENLTISLAISVSLIADSAAVVFSTTLSNIPEMIEIATDKHFKENQGEKHQWNARYGWYRYNSRFALPVFSEDGNVERYNVFHASLLIRHDNSGKMYLYDVIDIKKKRATLWSHRLYLAKTHFLV